MLVAAADWMIRVDGLIFCESVENPKQMILNCANEHIDNSPTYITHLLWSFELEMEILNNKRFSLPVNDIYTKRGSLMTQDYSLHKRGSLMIRHE